MDDVTLAIVLKARDEAAATLKGAEGTLGGIGKAALGMGLVSAAAMAGAAVAATNLATQWDYSTETLVTGAGESQQALGMVRQGILNMAGDVGQTPQKLAEGLYMIESAGFHGADALKVGQDRGPDPRQHPPVLSANFSGRTLAFRNVQVAVGGDRPRWPLRDRPSGRRPILSELHHLRRPASLWLRFQAAQPQRQVHRLR